MLVVWFCFFHGMHSIAAAKSSNFGQPSYSSSSVQSLGINVHLTFASPLLSYVTATNAGLHNETIRFPQPHTPHVTLYLSQFAVSSLPDLIEVIAQTVTSPAFSKSCSSKMLSAIVAGSYMMLPIAASRCLQSMSDILVMRVHHLALPNQTAPGWLLSLPEPQRSAKLSMLNLFGSPNVFSQYEPHVTLACSANVSELHRAARALDGILPPFNPLQVRVSKSGACGTALSNDTLLTIDLVPHSNSYGNSSNSSCTAVKVVSLQTGSSSSCSGGNTHVWPLLSHDECHGWSYVDASGAVHMTSANKIRCNSIDSFSFVQFAGSLDCSGAGRMKTFYSGRCTQVTTLIAVDDLLFILCQSSLLSGHPAHFVHHAFGPQLLRVTGVFVVCWWHAECYVWQSHYLHERCFLLTAA